MAFFNSFGFFGNKKSRKIWLFLAYFQSDRLGSGKTLSDLHTHSKSLATRVYYHAGCTEYCKNFTVALKMIDVIDKKTNARQFHYGERICFKRLDLCNIDVFDEF